MSKRPYCRLALYLLVLVVLITTAPGCGSHRWTVAFQDKTIELTTQPIVERSFVLLPIQPIMEALGAKVTYDEGTKALRVAMDPGTIEHIVGSTTALADGRALELATPGRAVTSRVVGGQIFVVPDLISMSLNVDAKCDPKNRVIMVNAPTGLLAAHPPITICLPFSEADAPREMMPMGETICHPDPPCSGGHPGIDFVWNACVDITASAEGTIVTVRRPSEDKDEWEVVIRTGDYYVSHGLLEDVPKDIQVGVQVVQGQRLGRSQNMGTYSGIHWELGLYARHRRICPMASLDEASRQRIVEIWDKSKWMEMKNAFPHICNNIYRCDFCKANGY